MLLLSQSLECEKFRNGKFVYPNLPGNLSVRKGDTQKSYSNGKLQAIWKVDWLDECTIQLTCKKITGDALNFKKGDRIYSEIISIDGDCMSIRAFLFQGEQRKSIGVTGTMCLE